MEADYRRVLESKHGEVKAQIEDLRARMKGLTDELSVREGQLRNLEELVRLETLSVTGEREQSPSASNGERPVKLTDAVAELLSDGKPLHYQAIAKRIQASGHYIPGKNPAANLLTQVSRDPRFRKTGRGTYAIRRSGS